MQKIILRSLFAIVLFVGASPSKDVEAADVGKAAKVGAYVFGAGMSGCAAALSVIINSTSPSLYSQLGAFGFPLLTGYLIYKAGTTAQSNSTNQRTRR